VWFLAVLSWLHVVLVVWNKRLLILNKIKNKQHTWLSAFSMRLLWGDPADLSCLRLGVEADADTCLLWFISSAGTSAYGESVLLEDAESLRQACRRLPFNTCHSNLVCCCSHCHSTNIKLDLKFHLGLKEIHCIKTLRNVNFNGYFNN